MAPCNTRKHQNAAGCRPEVDSVRNVFVTAQALAHSAVVTSHARVCSDKVDPRIECNGIAFGLRLAELLDTVEITVDQVAFGVLCKFNLRQATDPSAALPGVPLPARRAMSAR